MRSGLAYSRRLWLVAHSLGSVSGVWLRVGKRSDGRRNSSQSGNGTGGGSPTVSPFVERGAAAVAVEAVGGGGLPRRTSQPRRRNNSAPRERFPPFVFSLPHLSGFIAHSQNNHKRSTFSTISKKTWQPAALFFFFLFLFFLFSFPFILLSFLFLLYYFSFLFAFRLFRFSFRFSFFVFSFFLSSHFCNRSGGGRGLAFLHSFPSFPLCRLVVLSIIKRPGA